MNPWLKRYKTAKSVLEGMKIVLYTHSGVHIPNTEKPLRHIVEYDFACLEVVGYYAIDVYGFALYGQELSHPIKLDDGTTLRLDFRKLKIENKWELQELIPEDDYI